ncbi:MAG: TIGR04076 family protein [Proteobacteria bacterium]|nr:TIGR04076 family protein [Pseudomonadota bacterium]MBI3496986.1 TIGR04076 family protein [Pseudomonadota bacterium]
MRRPDDGFELYDLRVEVLAPPGAKIYCNSRPGDWFEVRGELLLFQPGMPFSLYTLAALLPLLPAKQRPTEANDWMTTDAEIACPDPNCPTRFRISRLGKRRFRHAEVTAVPLPTLRSPAGRGPARRKRGRA